MARLNDKQISQVHHIIDTLLEATEHFSILIKKKELNQSIYTFTSVVEGFDTINRLLNTYQTTHGKKEREKIEQYLLLIAQHLEKGNLIKTSEILQFSFSPQLRRLKEAFTETSSNTLDKQDITIGVYFDKTNPRNAYPEERINALIDESEQQGARLLFFSSNDVDLNKREINADFFKNGDWQRISTSFPDIIHNIGVVSRSQQSIIDRKLRRTTPFTSFFVGNKLYLPKKLVQYRKYAELLVFFKMVTNDSIIFDFLAEHNRAVLKPILGRRGENIYYIEKKGNHYLILDHKQEHMLGNKKFHEWIQNIVLKEKNSYMIQKYVDSQTKNGEPFDIRAHMQKNGEGKWQITRIYPRIGSKKSILSNISRGGRTEELDTLLIKEFGEKGKLYSSEIRQLAHDLTRHLDKLYGSALDELGLDLTIDKSGRFWLHEVNNGPQSTYHEKERAVNTIGYAIYLAENGIVNTNELQSTPDMKEQFNARSTDLTWANLDNNPRIAMLVNGIDDEELAVACAYVAKYEDVNFYLFNPKDIDFDEMLIRGHFYENNKWVEKIVEYPDVIYDRLRLRGIKGYNLVYQELDGIPFTNEFYGNSISKLEVYDKLTETKEIDNNYLIPYQEVKRIRDIFNYIENYGQIILKPEIGSFAQGVHFISKESNDTYFVAIGEKEAYYNEISLSNYLRDLIKKGAFIVQKYIETRTIDGQPFDIRVHMMKNENGEWSFVKIYPRVGVYHAIILVVRKGGYIGKIDSFLERNYGRNNVIDMKKQIEDLSHNIVTTFEQLYDENINELALDFAIDKSMNMNLIEINVNKPGIVNFEFDVAKHAIPYAKYLSEKKNEDNKELY
ncbi:YheC/YheD family protein [Virgibacillus oceani]